MFRSAGSVPHRAQPPDGILYIRRDVKRAARPDRHACQRDRDVDEANGQIARDHFHGAVARLDPHQPTLAGFDHQHRRTVRRDALRTVETFGYHAARPTVHIDARYAAGRHFADVDRTVAGDCQSQWRREVDDDLRALFALARTDDP